VSKVKVVEMANAVVPIDNIIYADRDGACVYLHLKESYCVKAHFPSEKDAEQALAVLCVKMELQ
jgi:hypothetical protein